MTGRRERGPGLPERCRGLATRLRASGKRRAIAPASRRSLTVWSAAAVTIVIVVATTGLGVSVPSLGFRQAGHWVYNHTLGAVFHVDGGSKTVDAKVKVTDIGPANQVVQGDRQGFVVGQRNGRVIVFAKSTLTVDSTLSTGTSEEPIGLEVLGGPYLVYERGGSIVRLGQPAVTVAVGGPLGQPIATTDGTLWVERVDTGALCKLTRNTSQVKCPAQAPRGHQGALTALDDRPAFVDTTADTVAPITSAGLGRARPLAADIPPNAMVAASDAGGRLPIVSPGRGTQDASTMVLVDTSTIGTDKPGSPPIEVPLGTGRFSRPATSGGAVAVIDATTRKIVTVTSQGVRKASMTLPAGAGDVRLSRGEDGRVYADAADGGHTMVVDGDGSVTTVEIGGNGGSGRPGTTSAPLPPGVSVPPGPGGPGGSTSTPGRPGPPRNVEVVPGAGIATVSWTPPAVTRPPVTGYLVSWRMLSPSGPAADSAGSTTVSADTLHTTLYGLVGGQTYVVTVAARNSAGLGPGTESAAFTLGAASPSLSNVHAVARTDGSVGVTWSGPDGGATTYTVTAVRDGGAGQTVARTSATRAVAAGLALGARYHFTVTATGSGGRTASSTSNPVIPFRAADRPGRLTASRGRGQVILSWATPRSNGSAVTGYVVEVGSSSKTVTKTSATITGLRDGATYRFTVRALTRDPNGTGEVVTGVPAGISSGPATAPRVEIVSAAWIGSGEAAVRVKVADDGGNRPVSCSITLNSFLVLGPYASCDRDSTIILTGLNDSTDYQLQVSGENAAGTGSPSESYPLGPNPNY
jgi:hypothetical protein